MLGSTVNGNFKNLNSTFGQFSAVYSMTWNTSTVQDNVLTYNGPKYFFPVEAMYYIAARTGTITLSMTVGNSQGSAIYFNTSPLSTTVGTFTYQVSTAFGLSRVALSPGAGLWVRLSGGNAGATTNSVTIKVFVSGIYR